MRCDIVLFWQVFFNKSYFLTYKEVLSSETCSRPYVFISQWPLKYEKIKGNCMTTCPSEDKRLWHVYMGGFSPSSKYACVSLVCPNLCKLHFQCSQLLQCCGLEWSVKLFRLFPQTNLAQPFPKLNIIFFLDHQTNITEWFLNSCNTEYWRNGWWKFSFTITKKIHKYSNMSESVILYFNSISQN